MTHDITDADARSALTNIERRRRQIVAEIAIPRWYWWGVALGWIALGVITDLSIWWLTLTATLTFGAVHSAVAQHVLSGRHGSRQLSVRAEVVDRRLPLLVFGGLIGLAAVTIVVAVLAQAAGAAHPVTIASVVVADRGAARRAPARRGRPAPRRTGRRRVTANARFDELIHPSTRLSIVALLASADWIDFAFVRDRLGLSDSALSKQFATLEDAGYIAVDRPVTDRRRRVRVRLTDAGRDAFEGHVAALRAVVATADSTTASF